MTDNPRSIDRRAFLKQASMAASAAFVPLPEQALALDESPPTRAMRRRTHESVRRIESLSAPPLEVIALNRMAFGPRPGDFDAFRTLGQTPRAQLQAYVEQQLAPDNIDDSAFESRLAAVGPTTLNKSLEQLWIDHMLNDEDWEDHIRPLVETTHATLLRAVYSRRQLVEVLADFWHNHFNVYGWQYDISPIFVQYDRDVIRAHLLGNFREMLEAVAGSPTMLFYLDNYVNSRSGPNENYARELFEIQTLGAENYLGVGRQHDVPGFDVGAPIGYVDDDVYEATRAFTGWRVNDNDWQEGVENTGTFLYYDQWHDRFQKTVLGQFLPADQEPLRDGRDVLDILAAHPGTGRHIARKLCRRLVGDHPPEDIVNQAAAVFTSQVNAPDQLAQVVRTILLSEAFSATWGDKIKRPFEVIAGALRGTAAEFNFSGDFYWFYRQTGQELFSWPAPDGYPDEKEDWSTTGSMVQRWRFVGAMFLDWFEDITVDVAQQTPDTLRTANALCDYWIDRLLGRVMDAHDRLEIVEFMAQGRNPDFDLLQDQIDERLPSMVHLILMSPDWQYR